MLDGVKLHSGSERSACTFWPYYSLSWNLYGWLTDSNRTANTCGREDGSSRREPRSRNLTANQLHKQQSMAADGAAARSVCARRHNPWPQKQGPSVCKYGIRITARVRAARCRWELREEAAGWVMPAPALVMWDVLSLPSGALHTFALYRISLTGKWHESLFSSVNGWNKNQSRCVRRLSTNFMSR